MRDQEKVTPTHYTEYEGGKWNKWTKGQIFTLSLNLFATLGLSVVDVFGLKVHSLLFEEERWDCVNGWTRRHDA